MELSSTASVENKLNHIYDNYFVDEKPLITSSLKCVKNPKNLSGLEKMVQIAYVFFLKIFGKLDKTNLAANLHTFVDSEFFKEFKRDQKDPAKIETLTNRLHDVLSDLKNRFDTRLQDSLDLSISKI